MNLFELEEEIRVLQAMLDDSDEAVDEESFIKALDALNTQKESKLANLGLWVKELKADIEARREAIRALQDKNKAALSRIDSIRRYAALHLDKPLKTPLVSLHPRAGSESVEYSDEDAIPHEYLRWEPNTSAIKAALKAGDCVPGAFLVTGPNTVVIK